MNIFLALFATLYVSQAAEKSEVEFTGKIYRKTNKSEENVITIFLRLTKPSESPITCGLTISGGKSVNNGYARDYTLSSKIVTFPPRSIYGSVDLKIVNNRVLQLDKNLELKIKKS